MPRRRRERRERTHDWQAIQQYALWPEQKAYELLRPVVLFGETAAERARETGASERTLHHKVDQFDQQGMASLFHKDSTPSPDKARALPPDMRQLIVDLKAEHPGFRPHEIATICFLRFGRKPSDHTVQRVLADGKYSVELQEDRKHLRQVSNPRLADTPFRSPQLTLIDVGPHEWVLYWRVPPYAPARSARRIQGIVQLPLFDLPPQEKVVGGNEANAVTYPPPFLHLVPQSSDEPDPLNLE